MKVERHGPIITPESHPAAGTNINGPSLIRVPDWIDAPGTFALFFADHKGDHIRVAYADDVTGPYRVDEAGSLHLRDSRFPTEIPPGIEPASDIQRAAIAAEGYDAHFTPHIASPDVIVDHEHTRLVMAYHGLCADGTQLTRIAESRDGQIWTAHEPLVAFPYLRILPERFQGSWLGVSMPGFLYRSPDLLSWESGPMVFERDFRHCALLRRGTTLHVFWTRVGDAPEHILHSTISLADDWMSAAPSPAQSLLSPEEPWEGADLPVVASERGQVTERVNSLRDPGVFDDPADGRVWLLYAIAGESGIAIAELTGD